MSGRNVVLQRFTELTAAITAGFLIAVSTGASGASAEPIPDPSKPISGTTETAGAMARSLTVEDILRVNKNAKQVRPNAVNVSPGIDVILPPADGRATDPTTAVLCDYYYLCVWEHSFVDGFGVGLGFSACQPPGVIVNLGAMRYPDGANVGTGPGPKWNDRISSLENNQTPGTVSSFYNWTGSSWVNVLDSWAFDQVGNLRYSARGNVNDIIDAIHVCTS